MTFLVNSDMFPKPAGVISISPLLDVTGSFLPSSDKDPGLDWLTNYRTNPFSNTAKPSPLWPPSKPRWGFYSDTPLHPLVHFSMTELMVDFSGVGRSRVRPRGMSADFHGYRRR
jgi:hypothetical protein